MILRTYMRFTQGGPSRIVISRFNKVFVQCGRPVKCDISCLLLHIDLYYNCMLMTGLKSIVLVR